ncbi:hypothetical protein K469DRAFT_699812 [Zopfia rhizophila CBS 207.26]|uniref:Extracellular membrane protein CFEM domain-containing protein n=1 Tax=Zopfia rhizophila CBS 207.26 TaxID=1314779 RepID=A0A6A6EJ74_9PEZI|nr:hypothetical protein K469DRAFT_699812 [Zopfia rhizophila CBS 207.26]
MLLSHIKRLCTLLPSLIAALPQNSDPTSSLPTSLPVPLQRAVPACAQPCLRASLFDQFPLACTARGDFSCLCSRYSTGGESLGEVALGCIYASCSTVDSSAASAYNVCLGQRDAVPPTQTALTVTAASSIMSRLMATSTSVVTSSKPTPAVTTSSRTSPIPTNTVIVDSVSSVPSISSQMATPPSSATAAAAQGPKTMKPAQIAGLSVAAAATFVLAIGLMVFSVCLRRRRERRGVTEIIVEEKRPQGRSPKKFSARFSNQPSTNPNPTIKPPARFPMGTGQGRQVAGVGLVPVANKNPYANPYASPHTNPYTSVYTIPANSRFNQGNESNLNSTHPAFRPGAGSSTNLANASVPPEQIGLAISAELPDKPVPVIRPPQPPQRAESGQPRPKSLARRSESIFPRPDSVMTQDTVFEEDVPPERRRSSKLLPTPPIPIPPIRTFQPSRLPPAVDSSSQRKRTHINRQHVPQQPELFLSIPVRHSRSQPQPMRIGAQEVQSRNSPEPPAPPARTSSVYDQYKSISTSASTPDLGNGGDIPDYYFTSNVSYINPSLYSKPTAGPERVVRPKESPKLVNIKPKASSSTMSRTTSRASTNPRDSISSQTSFETVDPNDTIPEDEDEDKQLSQDNRLSPVVESPISKLRYPKIPRASNQLVPRSPKSPQSQKSDRSPRIPQEPSSLLVKRRGEWEAYELGGRLRMGNPSKMGTHTQMRKQHHRSNSVEPSWNQSRTVDRHTRSQSGQWPKSPAMYEMDVIQPLNIRSKQPQRGMEALKSPAWVPNLTPTRHGDDLFISVTYSKPRH